VFRGERIIIGRLHIYCQKGRRGGVVGVSDSTTITHILSLVFSALERFISLSFC
jgi:hypothetical protein